MTQRSLFARWWLRLGVMLLGAGWVGSILALTTYAYEHAALLAWAGAAVLAAALGATLSLAVDVQLDQKEK